MTRRQFLGLPPALLRPPDPPTRVFVLTSGRRDHRFEVHAVFTTRARLEAARKQIQATRSREEIEWREPLEKTVDRTWEVSP